MQKLRFSKAQSEAHPQPPRHCFGQRPERERPHGNRPIRNAPTFSPQERQEFQTFIRDVCHGRVTEVRAEGVIVVVEFDDEEEALEVANNFLANDRLELVTGGPTFELEPGQVVTPLAPRLSEASQWPDDDAALQAAEKWAASMEEAAQHEFLDPPPKRKH